jgi:hypothetical protein
MHLFRLTAASCNPLATNQIIIVIMDIERILKTRENAIYYGIGEYQKDCFGWVGGNAPACFDDRLFQNIILSKE